MRIELTPFVVHKRVAVAISRGTQSFARSLHVAIEHEGITGHGEAAEYDTVVCRQSFDEIARDGAQLPAILASFSPWERRAIEQRLVAAGIGTPLRAGVDLALHDWCGRRAGVPVWKYYGLPAPRCEVTSVTIGINTPEAACQRYELWQQMGPIAAVKVKLGSPQGIAADQAMFAALRAIIPPTVRLGVDANGGWDVASAIAMSHWLAERGVEHLEQPLSPLADDDLPAVHASSALPILVDESCRSLADVVRLGRHCSGVNIKLMKCGGWTEALRMLELAKALRLKTMLGCYSNSALGNGAAAQLAGLADYLDLDSHLNLLDDPFQACEFERGGLRVSAQPGWGITLR